MTDANRSVEPRSSDDRLLDTSHLSEGLRGHAVRGGAATFGAQAVRLLLRIATLAVLGRVLDPHAFGLVFMVTALTDIVFRLRDLGLSASTIQRERLTVEQISALFWINCGVGVIAAGVVAAASPLIAWFYDEPELIGITLALSVTFLLGGPAVQHLAVLRRQMHFTSFAMVNVATAAAGSAAAIVSALMGAGYWSLVFMQIANAITLLVGAFIAMPWRPGRPRRGIGLRDLLHFGGWVAGYRLIEAIVRNVDKVLIGRLIGAGVLGAYSNAFYLLLLPLGEINLPMSSVAAPTLSRLQGDAARYRLFYRMGVMLMGALAIPIAAFAFVCAPHVIYGVLGDDPEKWGEAVPILRALCPAGLVLATMSATQWAYVSLGHVDRQFRWMLAESALTVMAMVIGLQWGAFGLALGMSAAMLLLRMPAVAYCYHGTLLRMGDFLGALWRPVAASVLAALATWGCDVAFIDELEEVTALVLCAMVFAAAYVVAWMIIPGGRATIGQVAALRRDLARSM